MAVIKLGDFEIVVKDKDGVELDEIPTDLPVHNFEGDTVTLGEARDGYMRQADYTIKTQELGKMRDFLQNRVGVQGTEVDKGLAILNGLIDKVVELVPTGTPPAGGDDPLFGTAGGDSLTLEHLPSEVKQTVEGLRLLSRDVGALMNYISQEELTKAYPNLTPQDRSWAHSMAASDPSKTPMEWGGVLNERLEARGQEAIDAHVQAQTASLQKDGHDRPGLTPDEVMGEMYEEEVVFSSRPDLHEGSGKKVIDPSAAANEYMQRVLEGR
jgi:hypothetical protein